MSVNVKVQSVKYWEREEKPPAPERLGEVAGSLGNPRTPLMTPGTFNASVATRTQAHTLPP